MVAFDRILRLLHPVIPFVTAELWDRIPWPAREGERPEDLMVAPWPEPLAGWEDEEVEEEMATLQELVTEVRSLRKEYNVPEGQEITISLSEAPERFLRTLALQGATLERLARVHEVAVDGERGGGIGAHAVLTNGTELFLPLEGVVDLDRERSRLRDEIGRLEDQLRGAEKKLANEQFTTKAPEEVVEREREKAASFQEQVEKLREKLSGLAGD